MNISPTRLILLTSGLTLLGVIIPSVFNLLSARAAMKSEEPRQNKELVIKAALENWHGQRPNGPPLDIYIADMAATADVVFDPTTTNNNLADRLKVIDDRADIMMERANRLAREEKEKRERAQKLSHQ